ncbi:zf-HC2 domain-containing protein [Actinacidiphila glaucinigra]|uniref:zf-HC2 domain-containing protein n=1 Tax=Actinacidiphila glaucinigra TaxID=235986 RepID=UPI002E2F4222|nr:zf-HC2 domain-containing protein [Actinacidiphila glaucinigra]
MSNGVSRHLTCADQHLGDHLAAFVDGELHDDARDRVLAHLATCADCKAAADEQRRMKDVVAATAPPAISAGLLARLQELPGGDGDGGEGPFGDGGLMETASLGGERLGGGLFGKAREEFSLPLSASASRGFRIHESGRSGAAVAPVGPSPSVTAVRGRRRFAFAAAGAVSMAAIALGGALPLDAAVDGAGGTPLSRSGAGAPATPFTGGTARAAADVWSTATSDLMRPGSDGMHPYGVGAPDGRGPGALTRPLGLSADERSIAAPAASAVPGVTPAPALAPPSTAASSASPAATSGAAVSPAAPVPLDSVVPLVGHFPVTR